MFEPLNRHGPVAFGDRNVSAQQQQIRLQPVTGEIGQCQIETPGGIFYIDGASVLYLVGSTMDWQEDDFTAGFVFENPNAKGACGCGESFMV